MNLRIAIFLLAALGGFLVFDIPLLPSRAGLRAQLRSAAARMAQTRKKRETLKDYIARVNGTAKENFLRRSTLEAKQVYEHTGQSGRYQRTLRIAYFTAVLGAVLGLVFRNPLLSVVLAVGFYFLPLWQTQFALYRYNQFLNEELETTLNLITISYGRDGDILGAVEENLSHIHEPVRGVFAAFCNNLKYVDPNAPAQIERMKRALNNKLFHQWCDSLILCQDDHTLRAALIPIVNKFSDQKAQQQENETKMMLPLRQAIGMIAIVLSVIPLFWLVNKDWYANLVSTLFGQVSLVVTAVITLMTVNKGIRLSKPVEFDV